LRKIKTTKKTDVGMK